MKGAAIMNFVISHRQTSQSDSNPVILARGVAARRGGSSVCTADTRGRGARAKHGGVSYTTAERLCRTKSDADEK